MSKMITNRYTLVITTILLALLVLIPLAYAQQYSNTAPPFSIVSISSVPSPTITGVSKVSITLIYTGGYYLYNTEFSLTSCSGTVVSQNPVFIGWLNPGQEVTVTYLINSTLPINCQSTLAISWGAEYEISAKAQVTTYIQVAGSGSMNINFPLVIYGSPIITAYTKTQYLVSNLVNPVELVVSNNGSGSIYNLQVNIDISGATLAAGSNSIVIGTLNPGSNYSMTLYVLPISSGPMTINVGYTGLDQSGNTVSGSISISMSVIAVSSSQVIVYPVNSSLSIGSGELAIGIRNVNPVPIYNVTLVLTSIQGLSLAGNTTYDIAEIPPGATDYVYVPIAVPISSSSASITYSLTYQYTGGYPGSVQGTMAVSVLNKPSILVTGYQVAPTPLMISETGSVSLNFVNTGSVPAYNLNITAIPGPGIELISQSSTYMGTLNSQQLSAVAFSFTVTKTMNTTITFQIQYTDQFGQQYMQYYTVPITVIRNTTLFTQSASQLGSQGTYYRFHRANYFTYIIIALAVVAVALIITVVLILRNKHGGKS
ncbi:MAG: COG1361 S-layer family protein [Vulcanisaeta sp.]|uniref:COG1361 S-layer family protein n=1 Tax=Vulcanisaeta sp. TaxID=2020871 RepID=UPI003D0B5DA1